MNEIDPQWMFNGIFSLAGALCGWLLNSLRETVRELKAQDAELTTKVQHIEVLVAGSYVKREDLERSMSTVLTKLDRIETKLDQKADK